MRNFVPLQLVINGHPMLQVPVCGRNSGGAALDNATAQIAWQIWGVLMWRR
jgi:hypothetical protein